MNEKNIDRAREFAAQNSFYDDVNYLGEIFDVYVYEPIFSDGKRRCIGLPRFIIIDKTGTIHETSGDETWKFYNEIHDTK